MSGSQAERSPSREQVDWPSAHEPSFPKSAEFPIEIRRKIWNYSYTARNIFIESANGRCYGMSLLPVAFLVCKKSRTEALIHYKLYFQPQLRAPIYLDPEIDLLIFAPHSFGWFYTYTWIRTQGTAPAQIAARETIKKELMAVRHVGTTEFPTVTNVSSPGSA